MAGLCLSPFLQSLHLSSPQSNDVSYSFVKIGASWSTAAFKIKAGMESGPGALKGFSPLRSLCTAFQFTSVIGMSGHLIISWARSVRSVIARQFVKLCVPGQFAKNAHNS